MASLSHRQIEVLEALAARPREKDVSLNVKFDVHGSFFEVEIYARTFQSFIGHAGEMTVFELGEVIDRLVIEASRDPEPCEASPRLRLAHSNN